MRLGRCKVLGVILATMAVAGVCGCLKPGELVKRGGDEIVAAGQLFHTGTPVVLWLDPLGYDAYNSHQHFKPDKIMPDVPADKDSPRRFNYRGKLPELLKARVDRDGWTLKNLQEQVDQFVFHYDACGSSKRCFQVLHDLRGLSVHFMLDLDGTLYQTLDLKERAWHAGTANDRCIGVEIAHIGAYPNMETLNKWYALDFGEWPYIIFPKEFQGTGIRTSGFIPRSARKGVFKAAINGREVFQYDYTEQQYQALIKLTAAMARIFPKMKLDVPRNPDGTLRMNYFTDAEQDAFSGFMAHWHESQGKVDPGPAFD